MSNQNHFKNSLAHTKLNFKYHFVFAPKCIRKEFYEEKREKISESMSIKQTEKIYNHKQRLFLIRSKTVNMGVGIHRITEAVYVSKEALLQLVNCGV